MTEYKWHELRSVKMATSQRRVDPKEKVATYKWQASYEAALLETDWTKIVELVQVAESEIHKRRLQLSKDHGGTDEERASLVNAMSGLRVLKDVAVFLERQQAA